MDRDVTVIAAWLRADATREGRTLSLAEAVQQAKAFIASVDG